MTTDRSMYALDDYDPNGSIVTGVEAIRQAAYRRIACPPGGEYYAPEYGLGLSQFIGRNLPTSAVRNLVLAQLSREERIEASKVEARDDGDGGLVLDIRCMTAEGPFALTLAASSVTVEILQ